MKSLKKWLAFFLAVVMLLGVALQSSGPLVASQSGDQSTASDASQAAETADGVTVQEDTTAEVGAAAADPSAAEATAVEAAAVEATTVEATTVEAASDTSTPATDSSTSTADASTATESTASGTTTDSASADSTVTGMTSQAMTSQETANTTAGTSARTLSFEDDNVVVTVTANADAIIPSGVTLKVTPIVENSAETKVQYAEVANKVREKATENEKEIAGFLAYDIILVDASGNEVEPNGEVSVSMNYKNAVLPSDLGREASADTDVTLLHLEENKNGDIQNVVDLGEMNQVSDIQTTERQEVTKVGFTTESFSVYTVTWYNKKYYVHFVDSTGNELSVTTTISKPSDSLFNLSDYKSVAITGYTYSKTTVDGFNGTEISSIYRYSNGYTWYYTNQWKWWSGDQIYIVYTKDASSVETSTLGTPAHNKTIKANTTSGNGIDSYTLSLDVTGEQQEAAPIDILLVLDFSGSMASDNRIENLRNAIIALKSSLADASKKRRFV